MKLGPLVRRITGTPNKPEVAIISYPKSGRTWLRFMLDECGVEVAYDHAGADNRKALRFDEIQDRPREWRHSRILFLHRDPRDTAVSSYFQASKRVKEGQRFSGELADFIRDARYGVEKIARFNLLWLESRSAFRDFKAVSYEDLQADTIGELAQLIAFVAGRSPSPETIKRVVAQGRFDAMQKLEKTLGSDEDEKRRLGGGNPDDPESMKVRRGKVGGWRDYFAQSDTDFADAVLDGLDYQRRVAELTARDHR